MDLKGPFAQKDAAKELGARWDAARKIWYVTDPECIEWFSDWMPEVQTETAKATGTFAPKPNASRGVVSGPKIVSRFTFHVSRCNCNVLPWEHCDHSLAAARVV